MLYAELPFAVVAMGFLLCQQSIGRPIFGAAGGLLGAAAYLLRTAGVALFLAWVVESLIRRRLRQAAVRTAISALPVLLWQGYVWRVIQSDDNRHPMYFYQRADYYYPNVTYGENSRLVDPFRPELGRIRLRDLGERLTRNIPAIPAALSESAVVLRWFAPTLLMQLHRNLHLAISATRRSVILDAFAGCLIAGGLLALAGAVLVAIGQQWFLSLYFAITLAIVVITPWQIQFSRYLAPVAPLTLIFLFVTLVAIRRWFVRHHLKWIHNVGVLVTAVPSAIMLGVQIAAAAHLFLLMTPVSYFDAAGRERVFKLYDYGSEWHALDAAFEWIRRNAAAPAVIATTVPQLAYLRTGHKAVLPPFECDPNAAGHLLDEVPVTYLVLDQFGLPGISERYAAPVVAHGSQGWRLVFAAPDCMAYVYERAR